MKHHTFNIYTPLVFTEPLSIVSEVDSSSLLLCVEATGGRYLTFAFMVGCEATPITFHTLIDQTVYH